MSHAGLALLRHLADRTRPDQGAVAGAGLAAAAGEKTALRLVPEPAWQIAIDSRGEVRERRADDAYTDTRCAHRAC